MRIQELERQVGIERATIRYYEKEGLIQPRRSENGYRDYSEEDAAELRRIRLLRDLGVSLETIRSLQQGFVTMAKVMESQSQILRSRREQLHRAQAVCEQITADGAGYLDMDTARYQRLLETPAQPAGETVFRDCAPREPHPWRRYFARMLDHAIAASFVWFIIVVLLRWRPAGELLSTVSAYASWFVLMPLEALCLHRWGTTPGKWIFGIRIEAAEGGRLSFSDALRRAWSVFRDGMCLGIPLLNLYCMYKEGWKAHTEQWDTKWDEDCEISFRQCGWKHILLGIVLFTASVALDTVSSLDAELPRYRSGDLTVDQFASNFNFYDQYLTNNTTEHMEPDGTLDYPGYTQAIVLPDDSELAYDPNGQFAFETDGDSLRKITYHHSWYEYDSVIHTVMDDSPLDALSRWLPAHCRLAVITSILSQKEDREILAGRLERFMEDLKTEPIGNGRSFSYGPVTVSWALGLELYRDFAVDSSYSDIYHVTLDMTIEFQ